MGQTAFKSVEEESNEAREYREWAEAFKRAMLDDVEPLTLVDYNVATFLTYARETGVSHEEIERVFRPWILEGYRRAHERALLKFKAAAWTGDLSAMEYAFRDLIQSGAPLGMKRDELERRHDYFSIAAEMRNKEEESL